MDMTPLIDLVFLLVTFFLLTVNLTDADQNERIRLPTSELAKPVETEPIQRLTLQITDVGTVIFGTKEYAFDGLRSLLESEKAFFQGRRTNPRDVQIVIRGDARGETGNVLEVLYLTQELGFGECKLRATTE